MVSNSVNKTLEHYNKFAHRWAANKTNSFFHEKGFRYFEKLLNGDDKVIDIGCAYGIHVPLFLGIGRKLEYSGVDISKSMIRIARSRYPQIDFKVSNILNFKPREKFDAFWAAAVLMHIPEAKWPELLDKIESITKSKAIGYITLPEARPNPESKDDQRHFEYFDKKKFKRMADTRGWKILKNGSSEGSNNAPWHWFIVKLP